MLGRLSFGVLVGLAGCAQHRAMSAIVTDAHGAPISGALVYVEAWEHPAAYDFCFGITDASGRIPVARKPAPELLWKGRARLSYIAFAPGKAPFAVIGYSYPEGPENIHIQLQDSTGASQISKVFGFPFPEDAELSRRAANADLAPVRIAFRKYYTEAVAQGSLRPEGRSKLEALGEIPDPAQPATEKRTRASSVQKVSHEGRSD